MKAKVTGMTTWQDTPTSGTLRIWPAERYEDGNGNATPGRYDFALNVGAKAWRDERNSAADAYVVVAAPGEPEPVLAVFEETFIYANGARVVHIYRRLLVASDLNGTEYNYVTPQSVVTYTGSDPLSLQAARQLLAEGTVKLAAMDTSLAAGAAIQASGQAVINQVLPLRGATYSGATWNGIQVAWAFQDALGYPWFFHDLNGKMYVPGGIDLSNATGVQAERVQATGDFGYVDGREGTTLVQDVAQNVTQLQRKDGWHYFPYGVDAPNIPSNLVQEANGRVRINGVRAVSGPDIIGIGDSLTHGVGQTPYTTYLAQITGRDVANWGLGGQTSTEIAARVGASAVFCRVAGDSIPASGAVSVTVYDVDLLRTGAGASISASLYGVPGTLTRGASNAQNTPFSGAYTFTRTTAGAAVSVPKLVRIYPDTRALRERIAIIWVGNNNFTEDAIIQRDVLAIIRSLEAMRSRYLIVTMMNGDYPGRRANDVPNTDYLSILATNRNLMRLSPYGCDLRGLVSEGVADTLPADKRVDEIHPLSAQHQINAQHFATALTLGGLLT